MPVDSFQKKKKKTRYICLKIKIVSHQRCTDVLAGLKTDYFFPFFFKTQRGIFVAYHISSKGDVLRKEVQ